MVQYCVKLYKNSCRYNRIVNRFDNHSEDCDKDLLFKYIRFIGVQQYIEKN